MIKRLLFGIVIGLIMFFVFVYLGGGKALRGMGSHTGEISNNMKKMSTNMERIQRDFKKNMKEEYREIKIWLDKRR